MLKQGYLASNIVYVSIYIIKKIQTNILKNLTLYLKNKVDNE